MTEEYTGQYEGYINFLLGQKAKGRELTLVKTQTKLYCIAKWPDGFTNRWHYDFEADAELIAKALDIPLQVVEKGPAP